MKVFGSFQSIKDFFVATERMEVDHFEFGARGTDRTQEPGVAPHHAPVSGLHQNFLGGRNDDLCVGHSVL